MAEKQVRIDLVATDKASDKIDDVAEEVERLERADPEIEITADSSQAERTLEDVSGELKEIQRRDTEIVLEGRVGDLRAALKEAQGELDKVKGKAEATRQSVDDIGSSGGPRLAGNAVADLTGPLGEASGAASNLGGVFDGMSDIAEAAFTRMGHAAAGATASMALGGIGFAVAALGAGFAFVQGQAKKAEERQQDLIDGQRELNDAIREGDRLRFAEQLTKDYGKAYDAARRLGLTAEQADQQVTEFITGQTDALPGLADMWVDMSDAARQSADGTDQAALAARNGAVGWLEQYNSIVKAREEYENANVALDEQEGHLDRVAAATGIAKKNTEDFATAQDKAKTKTDNLKTAIDKLRGALSFERTLHNFNQTFEQGMAEAATDAGVSYDAILDMKDAILEVAEFAGLTPIEVQSLLEEVEQGDLLSVKTKVNSYYQMNPAGISTTIEEPTQAQANAAIILLRRRLNAAWAASGGTGTAPIGGPSSVPVSAGPTVNVTQYVPRGYRGDLVADGYHAAKRSGGLYFRNHRR